MRKIHLEWQGPMGVGRLKGRESQGTLAKSHLYILTQAYPTYTAVYIGQAKNLLNRLWQHYRDFLGLQYYVRNAVGEGVYNPSSDYMLEKLNELADEEFPALYRHLLEDLRRIKVCYAPCESEYLDPAESILIAHALEHFPSHKESEIRCENGRLQNYGSGGPIKLEMGFKLIADDAQRRVVNSLFKNLNK